MGSIHDRFELFKVQMGDIVSEETEKKLLLGGFFKAPASAKHHHNYPGGLFDHSSLTTVILTDLTSCNGLKWQRPESPRIVGMFHDLCKMDEYILHEEYDEYDMGKIIQSYTYNTDTELKGHGEKSVMLLSQYMTLTEEEIFCIRYHMGAFTDKSEWNDYTGAVSKYPNVLWTHHADMLATHQHEYTEKE